MFCCSCIIFMQLYNKGNKKTGLQLGSEGPILKEKKKKLPDLTMQVSVIQDKRESALPVVLRF